MKSILLKLARMEFLARQIFKVALLGLFLLLRLKAGRYRAFGNRLRREKEFIAQIRLKDHSLGRTYRFGKTGLASAAGIHEKPDMTLLFDSPAIAVSVLIPPPRLAHPG